MLLDDFIKIEEFKNEHGRVISRLIRIELNYQLVKRILKAKSQGKSASASKNFLAKLRYYILSDGENHKRENHFQSGLTFCTYYQSEKTLPQPDFEAIVMRSAISFDGDITHQIRRDSLENSQKCLAIANAHYWVIEQLLTQLRLKATQWLNWVSWILSLLIVFATFINTLAELIQLNFLTVVLPIIISWLLQRGIKYLLILILPSLRRWFWRRLLLYFLSPRPFDKNMAKMMLRRFIN